MSLKLRKLPCKRGIAALVLGGLTTFGFAPFHMSPVPVIAGAGLFLIVHNQNPRQIFWSSFCFSLGLLLSGVHWIFVSLHDYGNMHPLLAGIAVFVLCVLFALPLGLVQCALGKSVKATTLRLTLVFPVGLALSDWTRDWFLTGFPWLAIGYSHVPTSPLSTYFPVFGVYGVSLASAVCSGTVAYAIQKIRDMRTENIKKRSIFVGLLPGGITMLAALLLYFPSWTQEKSAAPLSISMIQGNIPQDVKWSQEWAIRTLKIYENLIVGEGSDLVLLPETALPVFEHSVPSWFWASLSESTSRVGNEIILGLPEKDSSDRLFNSLVHIHMNERDRYKKHRLVPFGDYFPSNKLTSHLFDYFDIPMSDFSPGPTRQKPFQVGEEKIGVDICYEDVFGEEIIKQLPEATILANFTNDAWWGNSIGPWQHLQIAQARALESGRDLLRVTNTGITAHINHKGQIIKQADQFNRTILRSEVLGRIGSTPYAIWGNYAILVLCGSILFLCLMMASVRPKDQTR